MHTIVRIMVLLIFMKSMQRESIPWKILVSFGELAGGMLDIVFSPPKSFAEVFGGYREIKYANEKWILNRNIKRLEKGDYISIADKNSNLYQLTSKGKVEIIKERIIEKQEQKWDSKWRVIIFDIPEKSRRERDLLRLNLRNLGFMQLQKSVWITPYDIEQEIKFLFNLFEHNKYVRFITADKINFDQDLRSLFSL